MHNIVQFQIIHADGTHEEHYAPNLRTNAGANWQADLMGAATSALTAIRNIALSTDTAAPASTDTNLASELTGAFSRKTSTYTYTASASTYTLSATWQNTSGSTITLGKAAIVFAPTDTNTSADTHFTLTLLNPVASLSSGDTFTVNWGIGF